MLGIVLVGCANNQPFKQSVTAQSISSLPGVSRITITGVNNNEMRKRMGNDFAIGSLKLNNEFLGNFTRESQVFSHEIRPGNNTIEVYMDGMIGKPVSINLIAEPNTHYFYRYDWDTTYLVLGVNYSLKLTPVDMKPYKNSQIVESLDNKNSNNSQKTKQPRAENNSNDVDKLEAAKKRCIELGFKPGTESFGGCVLRIAK
jgi:hypothetical protein